MKVQTIAETWGNLCFVLFNPRKHFTFFAAESDILGVENDKKSEVLFIQFLCFMKGKLKINGFF